MTLATTAADLLPAICDPENFGDDALRLAYSDALEEQGESVRANYVRVRVEWDGLPDCGHDWVLAPGGLPCPTCRRKDELRAAWTDADGFPPWERQFRRWFKLPRGFDEPVMRRGFVAEVSCACADWLAHGPALVRRQPVEAVRLTDRKPADSARVHDLLTADGHAPLWAREGPHRFTWFIGRRGCTGGRYIPAALGRHWPAARYVPAGRTVSYGSEAEAHAALSAAALAWARATEPKS